MTVAILQLREPGAAQSNLIYYFCDRPPGIGTSARLDPGITAMTPADRLANILWVSGPRGSDSVLLRKPRRAPALAAQRPRVPALGTAVHPRVGLLLRRRTGLVYPRGPAPDLDAKPAGLGGEVRRLHQRLAARAEVAHPHPARVQRAADHLRRHRVRHHRRTDMEAVAAGTRADRLPDRHGWHSRTRWCLPRRWRRTGGCPRCGSRSTRSAGTVRIAGSSSFTLRRRAETAQPPAATARRRHGTSP